MNPNISYSKEQKYLLKVAALGAAFLGLVSIYKFYKNSIWRPRIVIKEVDYANTKANLEIDGKPFLLEGDSTYLISYDWGIKFGFSPKKDGKRVSDRIEILKRGMVKDVIKAKNEVAFTGTEEDMINRVKG